MGKKTPCAGSESCAARANLTINLLTETFKRLIHSRSLCFPISGSLHRKTVAGVTSTVFDAT